MKKIITTVGTSIFSNYFKEKKDKTTENHLKTITEATYGEWEEYLDEIQGLKKSVLNWAMEHTDVSKISAEIKSLKKLKEELENVPFDSYILATETIEGRLAAEILKEYYENIDEVTVYFNPDKDVIKGLQVKNADMFESVGIRSLFTRTKEIFSVNGRINNKENMINITGGYKGVIPYLSVFGQLYDIPAYYIYEESDKLLKSPSLPVQFDWSQAEWIYPYLSDKNLKALKQNKGMQAELRRAKLIHKEYGNLQRTALGELYCDYIDENILIANQPLGFIVELLLYEFYIENPYLNKKTGTLYQNVKHSVGRGKDSTFNSEEIDFVLSKAKYNKKDEPFVAVEVKSFLGLLVKDNFEGDKGVKSKLQKRLDSFKETGYTPSEYHYVIHMDQKYFQYFDKFQNNLLTLRETVSDTFPNCIVKFYYINLNLAGKKTAPGTNQYKRFLSRGLKINDNFGEIKID